MKSVSFAFLSKQFDNQYTFELQGYLSVADFNSTFHLLNQSVANNPPPGNKMIWIVAIWALWIASMMADYFLWDNYNPSVCFIVLPFFMVLITILFIWRHRFMRQRFEKSVFSICNRINATENIRGINYRFKKNGSDIKNATIKAYTTEGTCFKPRYTIVIEFDNRYNALSSQQFNRYPSIDFVTIPLFAHVAHGKDEKNNSFWKNQKHEYDEKLIIS